MGAPDRKCSVAECSSSVGLHGAKGMCSKHYGAIVRKLRRENSTGICLCGCGQPTFNGNRFRHGHWAKTIEGISKLREVRYVGARSNHGDGYITVTPAGEAKLEHIHIAELALGKPLPKGSEVHHVDGNRSNNSHSNLVICQDRGYHALLHQRQRALDACGHSDWRKCAHCGEYDDPKNLYLSASSAEHRSCGNEYRKAYYKRKRAQRMATA